MPQGLQVWDAQGRLRFDTSTRVANYIGSIVTGTGDGSLSVPSLALGQPFVFLVPDAEIGLFNLLPAVWTSGTTVHWAFYGANSKTVRTSATLVYGFF
ncbi:hypothetical protein D3C84_797570 [compost metagenome]